MASWPLRRRVVIDARSHLLAYSGLVIVTSRLDVTESQTSKCMLEGDY